VHRLAEDAPFELVKASLTCTAFLASNSVPLLCLVDGDPHGLDIFSTYRNGSSARAFEDASLTAPRLEWIGVGPSDLDRFDVDRDYMLPLTPADIKKSYAMLRRDDLQAGLK